MKHTPGPWRVSEFERQSGGASRVVMGADDFAVAWLNGRTVEEHEADARLIAAAPEMLEALKTMEQVFAVNGEGFLKGKIANDIRAAITNAEGRQPQSAYAGKPLPTTDRPIERQRKSTRKDITS